MYVFSCWYGFDTPFTDFYELDKNTRRWSYSSVLRRPRIKRTAAKVELGTIYGIFFAVDTPAFAWACSSTSVARIRQGKQRPQRANLRR